MNLSFPDLSLPSLVIVDDSEDDTFLLRHRLRAGGLTHPIRVYHSAADAAAALHAMRTSGEKPYLLFTDIRMPEECGFTLIGQIREDCWWDDMKIAVITSSNHPSDLARALELRVDGYLIKFPPPDLLTEFVRQGPWFSVPRPHVVAAT